MSDRRQELMLGVRRLVVKVGSGLLTAPNGLDVRRLERLTAQIVEIRLTGRQVVLVSSGAIAAGFKRMGFPERPKSISDQQACAAVGQASLIMAYEKILEKNRILAAQVLLTAGDLNSRRRYINARNTLCTLLRWGVLPIINENDTVAAEELRFGDNDTLSGMIAGIVEADLLVNLTDIDGLYDSDPRQNPDARFLSVVDRVDDDVQGMASRIPGALGAGGMYTKVLAARRIARRGVPTVIANGRHAKVLSNILAGQPEGTLFLPRKGRLSQRKHWIAFTARPRGRLVVDDGAKNALLTNGKSLLPKGVLEVDGRFGMGDVVEVRDREGALVAVGLTNYPSEDLTRIAGCHSRDIHDCLGYKHSDEAIHRDNMVVGDELKA